MKLLHSTHRGERSTTETLNQQQSQHKDLLLYYYYYWTGVASVLKHIERTAVGLGFFLQFV
jgi:hypothetical protein